MHRIPNPREVCRNRLAERSEQVRRLSRQLRRLVKTKRFSIYTVVGYAVIDPTAAFLIVPLLILLVPTVLVQHRIACKLYRTRLAAAFYRGTVARIEDRWVGRGDTGARYLSAEDLFADDLELFGQGSLFQFLCTARTSIGKDMLANWLTHPEDAAEIHDRQAAVRELGDRLEVRERLAVLELDRREFQPEAVTEWGRAPDPLPKPIARVAGIGLVAASVVAAMLWSGFGFGTWSMMGVLVLEFGFFVLFRESLKPISACGHSALKTRAFLSVVRVGLRHVSFDSSRLSKILSEIDAGGTPSTSVVYAMYGFVVQRPPLLLLVCQIVPGVDRWRRVTAAKTQAGLSALGELEALTSLAQYDFEQPDTIFPELVRSAACYEAAELGHPLIPSKERVKNDLLLNNSLRLLMISGSNMSGKSTMLRTVGVNAVLAQCGGPVCAKQLRISPFSIGTAMRFQDSLEQKTSHFYAVITRLRAVMRLQADERPLLFLIDEILQGTNSRDRVTGAKAVVQKLVDGGGVGLVTTHDLELTRIVDTLKERAANVHFVDRLIDGEIHFDYIMRPGIVQTSNALALMRKMGLDV